MRTHLRPTAAIAPQALLPGDPKRAMELATRVLERPLMSNLSRGLWGYHGATRAGLELTVQSTGIGGPSAAVVLEELARLGVRRAIRIGTCRALDPNLRPGMAIAVERVVGAPGARGDAALTASVAGVVAAPVGVACTDLYYDPRAAERDRAWRAAGAHAVELTSAALFEAGARAGVAVASVLVVAAAADGTSLGDEDLDARCAALGEQAAGVLETAAQASGARA